MSDPRTGKGQRKAGQGDAAQTARERELRDLIERVEQEQSRSSRPDKESPHDYVERRMREKTKK